ncbi:Lipase [Operophtera brumata]|uniref:Lipase n=1 Tax=Operophtera brumata TaxID=104452 RepID=A0A0L7L5L9_OPEBR|nr:Lipase [Operophtera brumata]
MFRLVIFVAACVALAAARRSPNADYVEDLMKSPEGSRFSDNINEDALLDVVIHNVVTSDGYILELHRIPHGRGDTPGDRPAVLLVHGLLSSSADYLIMGPGNALGYLLADAGYDVWLGNARGNYYSRQHISLNPDSILNKDFWRFSWDQIGLYDLPAFIDYILKINGQDKLHYIGHSQGGTSFLVLNSLRPEYNEKFISFQGLAPASFFDNNENTMFNTLANYESILETTAFALNAQEIFGSQDFITRHCVEGSIFNNFCQSALSGLFNREYYNSTMLPVILGHTPAGAAIRQVAHYGQVIRSNSFRRYNYNALTNLREYGSLTPPEYNLSLVTAPAYLHYGLADRQVDYRDLLKLANILPNVVKVNQAERETFNHFDFLWAMDVKEVMYDDIVASMRHAELNL